MNKRLISLFIILILIGGGIYYLELSKRRIPIPETQQNIIVELKEGKYPKAPELVGISGYLNTDNITINDFTKQGKVVLIDFWTYTCINCIRTFPFLNSWDEKYRDKGLVIIGVHTPEFTFEEKYENVQDAIEKYDIKYPVVQDNDYATWQAYKNNYWPRKYLIDNEGYIRYDHIGEGAYEETEEKIKELLDEIGSNTEDIELTKEEEKEFRFFITPELFAGHSFALPRDQNIGNDEGLQPGITIDYKLPSKIENNEIYLEGKWTSNPDDLQLTEDSGSIVLKFVAGSVNIVADSLSDDIIVEVFINDNYISKEQAGSDVQFEGTKAFVIIDKPQLYNIVEGKYLNDELTLKITAKDFIFSAFTFG